MSRKNKYMDDGEWLCDEGDDNQVGQEVESSDSSSNKEITEES